jgi:hypothetical protein
VYSIFVVIIFVDLFKYLTIGIKALYLTKEGKNVLLFLQNSFREEKEGDTSGSYLKLYELNLTKQIGYLNLSR